ncbi:transposase family protein, partial [Xanthobacter flavus]
RPWFRADSEWTTSAVTTSARGLCFARLARRIRDQDAGEPRRRTHGRYHRHLADLPMASKPARFVVRAQRFHCDTVFCGQRFFVERFDAKGLAQYARRDCPAHHTTTAWR